MRAFATVREAPAARPPRRASHPRARPGRAERAAGVPAVRGGPLLAGELRHGLLQRCGEGGPCACSALDEVGDVLRTPGTALASPVKEDMEARFGADFSHVRIHQGTAAAASARAVDALAYTVGSHIVFGEGQPATGRLLAHELAHVLQQGTGESAGPLRVEDPGAPAEREAAVAADAVAAGRAPVIRERASGVHRSIGSPAGGCGVCYGSPANAGTQAHILIEEAFRGMYVLVATELPLLPSPADDNGRLDLAMPVLPGLAIGEIKPANPAGLLQGDLDLFWYEQQIARMGIPTTRLRLPPPPPIAFPNPGLPGCPPQTLVVLPPVHGIYQYYCEPDYAELVADPRCACGRREPVPVPVPVPVPEKEKEKGTQKRRVLVEIREFVRQVVRSGEDATEAARRFVAEHPEVVTYIKAAAIGAAVVIVVGTILEDVATLGAGLADDPASFAAAYAIVKAAMEVGERVPSIAPAL